MTDLTPVQEEALNRAIAEFEGTNIHNGMIFQADYCMHMDVYTDDLDAIVDVVQRWCEKREYGAVCVLEICGLTPVFWFAKIQTGNFKEDSEKFTSVHKQPALALCLAFAKAAGIDWEGKVNGNL